MARPQMASRGPSQQLPQEENSTDRKRAQFPTNIPSRKNRVVKGVAIPPMTHATVRVATLVGGLCFLQNHPKTAHKNLCLMAQRVMDLFPGEPFTVLVSNFGNRAVHVPKHTVVGLALTSPTHILTHGVAAPGEADAKEGGGNKINSSTAGEFAGRQGPASADGRRKCATTTEGNARREEPGTDADRINSSTAEECARREGPVGDAGGRNSPTGTEGRARREKSDTDDAHSGNPANADERTDTDAEKTRAREEDVHIGAEDSTVRSEIMDMLSEFKDIWSGRLGKIGATNHRIELKPGARPIYQAPYRAGPIAREKEKTEIDRMPRAGVIEPTSAEWISPVVFVPKKDETMRFRV